MAWFETFFTPLLFDFWCAAVPPEVTAAEVDFLVRELKVEPPAHLLDLPCGTGRHALALTARGFRVTGIDVAATAIASATTQASAAKLDATFRVGDMRSPVGAGRVDAAYCFGNSFTYLSHDDLRHFIRDMLAAVRPGARWVIDTGCAAETLLPQLVGKRTLEAGGVAYIVSNRYDSIAGRLFQESTLTRGEERQTAEIDQGVYTVAEFRRLLEDGGWKMVGTYGDLTSKPFAYGDRRLLLVAQRP